MTNKADITLPPLPEARIVSYQTDSTMRSMELRTYSDEDMRDYARAAVQANSLSADDLADIDDALANLIQDKRDYCPHEDGTAEHVARLEALRQRLTHGGNCAAVEADRQARIPAPMDYSRHDERYVNGWNDCRAEMISNAGCGSDLQGNDGQDHAGGGNEMVPSDEQAAFQSWAEIEYRNEDTYSARDYRMGLDAWKQRARYSSGQPADDDSADQWRRLALQFDGHRMQAIGWLKAAQADLPNTPTRAGIRAFLAAPPLPGEQVLAGRIAAMSQPAASAEPYAYIRTIDLGNGNTQVDLIAADIVGDLSQYTDIVSFEPLFRRAAPVAQEPVPYGVIVCDKRIPNALETFVPQRFFREAEWPDADYSKVVVYAHAQPSAQDREDAQRWRYWFQWFQSCDDPGEPAYPPDVDVIWHARPDMEFVEALDIARARGGSHA